MTELSSQSIAERASAVMHNEDACAAHLGISVVDISPGHSVVEMVVTGQHANGHGVCQGGIIATLADTAFAHAANSYNRVTVAQGFSVDFVRPADIGETLSAVAKEQHRGTRTGVYQVSVYDSAGKLVALFSGKSFQHDQPLFD